MKKLLIAAAIMALPAATVAEKAQHADTAEKAADPQDKMICKTFSTIGSLVATNRTCKTKREWDREHENIRHLNSPNSCALLGEGGHC